MPLWLEILVILIVLIQAVGLLIAVFGVAGSVTDSDNDILHFLPDYFKVVWKYIYKEDITLAGNIIANIFSHLFLLSGTLILMVVMYGIIIPGYFLLNLFYLVFKRRSR